MTNKRRRETHYEEQTSSEILNEIFNPTKIKNLEQGLKISIYE